MGSEADFEDNEMPVIGFIVRDNDLQVIEINRSKPKCRLCNDPFEMAKLSDVNNLDTDIQQEFAYLFQTYFQIPFDNNEKYLLCFICQRKCQDIMNLKNTVK